MKEQTTMTNSDNGNRPRTAAHHPGDRVRVKHNLRHDHHSYSVEQNRARQALAGQIGSIRERAPSGAYRVAPSGSTERGAWFEADELESVAPHAVGDRVKVTHRPELDRQFSTPHGAFARRRNDRYKGKITAESCGLFEVDTSGPERAWYDPSELEPIAEPVAAPDPLVSRQAEEALQAADRWRAEYQLTQRELGAVRLELQEVRQEAAKARGETGALAVRLGAAEAERDALRAACEAVTGPAVGVSAQALAAAVKEALAVQLAAVMRTADHRCADARRIAALEDRVAAVRAAWGRCRTWWSPASEDERAALEAVDAALGGAVDPDLIPCELTVTFSEWRGTAHAVPTLDREPRRWRLKFPMASPVAAAEGRNLITPGRDKHDATIGGWTGQVMVVQRAPVVGAAVELEVVERIEPKPAERECCWEQTVEQRVSEVEARVARLESGK